MRFVLVRQEFNEPVLKPRQTHRVLFPDQAICIAGDNDHRREAEGKPNVGREKAEQAAAAIGGFTLLPAFAEHDAGSDWDYLAQIEGRDIARQQLLVAVATAEREQIAQGLAADCDREHDRIPSRALTLYREPTAEVELER